MIPASALRFDDDRKPASAVSAAWTRALQRTAAIAGDGTMLLADVVDAHAARAPDAPALLSERGCLAYGALAERVNRYARWAIGIGLGRGDTVCLVLDNSPDYLAIWLGLSRVGVVAALINTQLAGASLAHCVAIAEPRAVIIGASVLAAYRAAMPGATDLAVWVHGEADDAAPRLDRAIEGLDGGPLDASARPRVTLDDRALLIYTSGTTGLPKAANVSHYRVRMWSEWFAGLMDVAPTDRLYDCLPMYHSVGGVVATGAMLAGGGSVLLRERFSASRFWDDVIAWDCTIFQYIGELCRYLVNQPEQAVERAHRLRLCCGNGLRADVWETFRERFAIPQILEFYAATEGSFSLFNVEERPGAIGKVPGFMAHRSPVALVRFDTETEMPVRGVDGLCLRCAPGETGEAIGRLSERGIGLSTRFEGYTSAADSERKVLRDVFVKGDAWFRTGDLMRKDAKGFFYFVDRVGDTFRWKGENVAASEVETALCRCQGVREAIVYGVGVPFADGRAGMAALVVDSSFDLGAFRAAVVAALPGFARPLFLRLRPSLDITGTFKPKKRDLAREGYDPAVIGDPLYLDDPGRRAYVAIDPALHTRLVLGATRL
jgi:fatty-acyl-CoA synthase